MKGDTLCGLNDVSSGSLLRKKSVLNKETTVREVKWHQKLQGSFKILS